MTTALTTTALTMATPTMTARTWALLLFLSVLWGGSFFFIGVAVTALPPFTIVALRVTLAAATLLAVLRVMGLSFPRAPAVLGSFLLMGLINNAIPFSLIVWGQTQVPSGVAAILNAMTPIFTVIAAHLLTADERMTRAKVTGACLGFAGVGVMMGTAALSGLGSGVAGQAAIVLAGVSYALAVIFGRRFRRMGLPPIMTAAGQLCGSTVLLVPVALLHDRPWLLPLPGLPVIASIVALAVVSTAFAYILYFRIIGAAGATNASLVTVLVPVSAIILGTLFLGETILPRHLAGMALIAAGLIVIDGRLLRRPARPETRHA